MIDLVEGKKNLLILIQILQASGFDITAEIYEKSDVEELGGANKPSKIVVEIFGSDAPLLTARNGEVLLAIEEVASQLLELREEELDWLCFDAENFKIKREESPAVSGRNGTFRGAVYFRAVCFPSNDLSGKTLAPSDAGPVGLPDREHRRDSQAGCGSVSRRDETAGRAEPRFQRQYLAIEQIITALPAPLLCQQQHLADTALFSRGVPFGCLG